MAAIVVPFRGRAAKLRLAPLAHAARRELALAMLADVLTASRVAGETQLVTDDESAASLAQELGAAVRADPGRGQGGAVAAALERLETGPILVVNADLPCAAPSDLDGLLRATVAGAIALVEARDGTTNALGLPSRDAYAPLYGAGSAERFRVHARRLGLGSITVAIPNLIEDVDTLADLRRVAFRAGPRTHAALGVLGLAA